MGHILKPLVPKFRPDLFTRLRDIAEKQVQAKLRPIVDTVTQEHYVAFDPIHMYSRDVFGILPVSIRAP